MPSAIRSSALAAWPRVAGISFKPSKARSPNKPATSKNTTAKNDIDFKNDHDQASSTKLQAPDNLQFTNSKFRRTAISLELDVWSLSGAWMLVLGAFCAFPSRSSCE